jgi:hypothetical protein
MRKRLQSGLDGPQHAAAQAASLTEVVNRLARFPGRKAVILFSEGLAVSPRLETVVDRAWRENVAIYTINARGLDAARSPVPWVRDIDSRELTGTSRIDRHGWNRAFPELDQTLGLGPLARHTGGFLVANTNDLVAALSEVNADRRAFYVLSYVSSNEAMDGSTRKIEVRVERPGLTVRARDGYVAAELGAPTSSAYELPILEALTRAPRPRDFEFAMRAYSTPKPGHVDLFSLLLEVPGNTVEFRRDLALKRYTGEVAVLTRIRHGDTVVASQSQLYVLTGDLPRLDEFRTRPLTYFRTAALPPGSYQLEAVVHDRLSNRASVTELALDVPDRTGTSVIVGDLILVRSLRRVKGSEQKASPLAWGRLLIDPSISADVERRRELVLAVPLIIRQGPISARLALLKDGRQLTELPVSLGKPDKDGRLMPLIKLPVVDLPSATYDAKLVVLAPGYRTERSTTLVVH